MQSMGGCLILMYTVGERTHKWLRVYQVRCMQDTKWLRACHVDVFNITHTHMSACILYVCRWGSNM